MTSSFITVGSSDSKYQVNESCLQISHCEHCVTESTLMSYLQSCRQETVRGHPDTGQSQSLTDLRTSISSLQYRLMRMDF